MNSTRAYSRDKVTRGRKLWRTLLAKHYGVSMNQLRRNPNLMVELAMDFQGAPGKRSEMVEATLESGELKGDPDFNCAMIPPDTTPDIVTTGYHQVVDAQ